MKKLGLDVHSFVGVGGLLATIGASSVSLWAGAAAGVATAVYMGLRAMREYVSLKADLLKEKELEFKLMAVKLKSNQKSSHETN